MATKARRKTKALNLLRKVKIDGRWLLLPVARTKTGYDWNLVVMLGKNVPSPPGTFYLEYREDGRKLRRAVGDHPRLAQAAIETQSSVLKLRAEGVEVADAPQIYERRVEAHGTKIKDVIDDFCDDPPISLRKKSIAKYQEALRSFGKWTKKTHVPQLDRQDLLGFMKHLVNTEGLQPGTAHDKAIIIRTVFHRAGANIVMKRGDWPRVTAEEPEIYTIDELNALFKGMIPAEYVRYQTFLQTGFRKAEVQYLEWPDLNAEDATLQVSKKIHWDFDPKNYHERKNPIPEALVDLLQRHRLRLSQDWMLIFPTSDFNIGRGRTGGRPDDAMLDKLKRIALRNGLNCRHCESTYNGKPATCKDKPICRKWTLHKFRHTYATTLLHDGLDLATVQDLLGHQDIESTMIYVRTLKKLQLADKLSRSRLAGLIAS